MVSLDADGIVAKIVDMFTGTDAQTLTNWAVLIHGPIDILTTIIGRAWCAYDPEANPIVHSLGTTRWVLLKVVMLGALVVVAPAAAQTTLGLTLLKVLVVLGAVLVLPNIPIIATCPKHPVG